MTYPILSITKRYISGFAILPEGGRMISGEKLPDNIIAVADFFGFKSSDEIIVFLSSKYPDLKYSHYGLGYPSGWIIIRYTDTNNLDRMLSFVYGYPCTILAMIGATFDYTDNSYIYNGKRYYCTKGSNLIIPYKCFKNVNLLPACLYANGFCPFYVRNGKVYYGNIEVANVELTSGDPLTLLDWEKFACILCAIAKS
ncbi:hypothetical protein AFV9_gp69 [Betalipothrixvirus uzonense]|uniref:Uncharacterized protein n=1 Tax=Betalipothrixvirus uzonense TaxID=512792 RepID=B2CRP6_9VIRU|nr:hypothetical protein AFV9_gp69 [Acidianus filamentous virus 9]ACB37303.1 hypothetical protein [Acidianus filamentous virus 9]